MNRYGWGWAVVAAGLVLGASLAWAEDAPLLMGSGRTGLSLESELSSRYMKTGGVKERERVVRQSLELAYGAGAYLDLFVKLGLGKVAFENADFVGRLRPLAGVGFRATIPISRGYFVGSSAQYRFGKVSTFDQPGTSPPISDQWTETNADFYAGTTDLIPDPEPDLRIYAGLRFSERNDRLAGSNQFAATVKQKTAFGEMIGIDYSDSKLFRFNVELGLGDRNNILIRFGQVF